jgi:hypothetical protein
VHTDVLMTGPAPGKTPSPSVDGVVCIQLTEQQAERMAPLVQKAAAQHKNVLFFALDVPFWQNEAIVWELQATVIPARIGHKILKLVWPGVKDSGSKGERQ